jgi:hypothetical protein
MHAALTRLFSRMQARGRQERGFEVKQADSSKEQDIPEGYLAAAGVSGGMAGAVLAAKKVPRSAATDQDGEQHASDLNSGIDAVDNLRCLLRGSQCVMRVITLHGPSGAVSGSQGSAVVSNVAPASCHKLTLQPVTA